jgi:hypothetical protein
MATIPGSRPAGGITVTWDDGPLNLGDNLPAGGADFGSGAQRVHVDQVGDGAMLEQHTNGRGHQVNFNLGDFFIQTSRTRDQLVLTFTPPVDAAAVQFAAVGVFAPVDYRAFVMARFTDGSFSPEKSITGTTSAADGGAKLLGLQRGAADPQIASLVFRAEGRTAADVLRRFGINQVTSFAQAAPVGMGLTEARAITRRKRAPRVKRAAGNGR